MQVPLTIAATENGVTESELRTALTLPATESPHYDADGNLTADSLWSYTYALHVDRAHAGRKSSA